MQSVILTYPLQNQRKNEKMRLQALLLVKESLSPEKVAEDFSVNRSTVYRWLKRQDPKEEMRNSKVNLLLKLKKNYESKSHICNS